jgi:hypothetical protein
MWHSLGSSVSATICLRRYSTAGSSAPICLKRGPQSEQENCEIRPQHSSQVSRETLMKLPRQAEVGASMSQWLRSPKLQSSTQKVRPHQLSSAILPLPQALHLTG